MSGYPCLIRAAIAVAVLAGVAKPASAQNRPRVELAGGYQLLKLQNEPLDVAGVGTFFPLGWFFEAAAPVSNGLTIVGRGDPWCPSGGRLGCAFRALTQNSQRQVSLTAVQESVSSAPIVIRATPPISRQDIGSRSHTAAIMIVSGRLSLSIGATRDAGPSCSAR